MSRADLQQIRRSEQRTGNVPQFRPVCGTWAGVQAHYRANERRCGSCRKAEGAGYAERAVKPLAADLEALRALYLRPTTAASPGQRANAAGALHHRPDRGH